MKEHCANKYLLFSIIAISLLVSQSKSATCTRERCCSISTCTSLYCQQQNSQTWISTQSYSLYQYTKLVMVNNQCKPCAYNCKSCASQSVCTICYDGYYKDSVTNKCKSCDYKCMSCQVVNSISKCSACDTGSYLDANTLSCALCPVGAQSCVDQTTIQSCQTGYLKSSNSMFCTPCPSNCLSCPSSSSTCAVCATGYFLSSGQCKACNVTNCAVCTAVGANVFCTTCTSGYYKFNNTVCSSCPLNCLSCTSSTICTGCNTGYYIQGGGCSLVSSSLLIPNCLYYSNTTSGGKYLCTSCQSGYYLSSTSLQCVPCSIVCTSCYGNHFGRCTACASNALLFNQMCIPLSYTSSIQMQVYFTPTSNPNEFLGGTTICQQLLFSGTTISLQLNNLSAYKLVVSYRIFTDSPGQQYTISLTSTTTSILNINNSESLTNQSSSQGYQLCTNANLSNYYYSHISQATFNSIAITNNLKFASSSSLLNLYIAEVLITAYQCSSLCLQCSQSQCFICLTTNLYIQDAYCVYVCDSGYYTYETNKQCVKQCPLGTYALLTNASCVACVSPCMTCLNDKFCLSCVAGYYLSTQTNTCLQICPYQYFASDSSQMCEKCVGRCNECIDDDKCLSCKIGFLENVSCVDTCSTGFYQNLTTLQCLVCSATCLTCAYAYDYCTDCPNGMYFYNNTCLSSCPQGYYVDSSSKSCLQCSYPCEQCQTSALNCLTCVDSYLLNSACISTCPTGYFQDNILLVCQSCDSTCTKCDSSATNCQACVNGYKLYSSTCVAACPAGYYAETLSSNITICSVCSGLCLTCLNQTYCLSCNSNFLADNNSGLCVRSSLCSTSFYANMATLKCQSCASSCLTCLYLANTCTSCQAGLILYNNTCISSCPSLYFYTEGNISQTCALCREPCLTCLNENQCLSCVPGYKYSSLTHVCSSTCSIGSFFNETISDCQTCSNNCLSCDSATFCYICNTSTYLYVISSSQNSCVGQCPTGYYSDSVTCMACLYPCLFCSSSIDCLSCQNGVLYQNRCLSGCPDSTFMNTTDNTCISCQGNCLTCKETATKCTLCKTGLYLIQTAYSCVSVCPAGSYALEVSKSCIPCPSACSQCVNTSYCISCISGKTYLNIQTHMCTQYCASGYFADAATDSCLPCASKCQTCISSSTKCLSCATGYLLLRLANSSYDCVTICPALYYNDTSTCFSCAFPCQQCTSSSACVTCAPGTYFLSSLKTCLMTCPIGSYYDTSTSISSCNSCVSPCATCINATNCISCVSGYLLLDGQCVTQCPTKFYADPSGICNRCYGLCLTCSGKYQCLTCLTGFAYSGYCYNACPPGTYASEVTKVCEPCQSPCLQCSVTGTYCKRCQFNMLAYKGQCSATCPTGTYSSGQICKSCQFPCVKCLNQFSCQQCIGGYLLYMNTSCIPTVPVCPNDLYKLDSIACVPSTWCPADYYRDEDLKTCSEACSPQKYVDTSNRLCLYSCNQGQYVGESMICQNWTTNPPKSLMAISSITYIKSSQIYISIVFNQTQKWLEQSENMYQISSLDVGRRLLQSGDKTIRYNINQDEELVLEIKSMPYYVEVNLPAYYVVSSKTNYNLQSPNITVKLSSFIAYTYEQVYTASIMAQFSEGISWFIILFSLFFLFVNRLSDAYILWDTAQLLYLLIFLDIQYPPNLNEFFVGMSNIHFLFVPSIFKGIAPQKRLVSSPPFYAYAYDNSFLRTAGSPILIIVIVVAIFLILKLIDVLYRKIDKMHQKLDEYPTIKNYLFKGLLRYRWHHTSDVFFLSYDIIVLFAVAQIYNIGQNPGNVTSNVISITTLLIYLAFPLFISYKLYKHYKNIAKGKMVTNLQCFYRGIEKTNKFGISLVLIRYFRKLTYCIIIGIFTQQPMFAIPILMFTSVLMGLFIFINKPFKKRLSNIITILTQAILVVVFIFIALVQFGYESMGIDVKVVFGWVCCGLLLIMLFALVFEIFCKTMFYLEPERESSPAFQVGKQGNDLNTKFTEEYIRQKAGEFFDRIFPRLKQQFNFDDSSEEGINEYQYEEGDSENSQNNEQRERNWGINSESESKHSQQFRHYGGDSEQDSTNGQGKEKNKAPNYLIRCVKQIK